MIANYKSFLKNSYQKTTSIFTLFGGILFFVLLAFILSILLSETIGIIITAILLIVFTLLYLIYLILYIIMLKTKFKSMILEINKEGIKFITTTNNEKKDKFITINNNERREIIIKWEILKKIIISRYAIFFLGNKPLLSIPNNVYEDVEVALKKYGHDNLVYCTRNYNEKDT